jgi:hypothetical protein
MYFEQPSPSEKRRYRVELIKSIVHKQSRVFNINLTAVLFASTGLYIFTIKHQLVVIINKHKFPRGSEAELLNTLV